MAGAEFEVSAEPPPSALRLTGAGAQTVLDQFRGSPLLDQGRIVVIGLDAIAQKLGSRWPVRSELVHEHAERAMRSQLGPQALVQRLSDVEYIVAHSEAPRSTLQLLCLNCLRDILTHFLGEAPAGELKLHEVTEITDDGVFGRSVDMRDVEQAERAKRAAAPPPEAPARKSLDVWTPFMTSTGLNIALSASLEPVLALKTSGRIGYRIAARVHHKARLAALSRRELERLSPADIERSDFGAIARGLDRVIGAGAQSKPAALIVPVSHTTLHSRSGRATLIALLRKARTFVEVGLIAEITGIEGAPASQVLEGIAALRPLTLHVIGRIANIQRDDARHMIGVGLDGISARCPRLKQDSDFLDCVRNFAKANGRVGRGLFLYQAPDLARGRMAAEQGVTHITLAPQRLKVTFLDDELH